MPARLEALRRALANRADALGHRAAAVGASVGARAGAAGQAVGASFASAGRSFTAGKATIQSALADLRLGPLPAVRRRSRLERAVSRLNLLSAQRLEAHEHLREYWEHTWSSVLRLRLRGLNPARVTWNLARDARQALIFLLAMWSERY